MSSNNILNVELLRKMLISASNNLFNNSEEIDALNVFPVPDGDTGSNMSSTTENAVNDIKDAKFETLEALTKAFAKGLLMGARGNSGVIFSQIFKGFSKAFEGATNSISNEKLVEAVGFAKAKAYTSVLKPVEGTMLTAVRVLDEKCQANKAELMGLKLPELFSKFSEYLQEAVKSTKDMLQQLKDANVVDSGATGVMKFFQGMELAVKGKDVKKGKVTHATSEISKNFQIEKEYGYCTEFIVKLQKKDKFDKESMIFKFEELKSESIVVVHDDDIVKTHLHSQTPGLILDYAQKFGDFQKVKIENMSLQAEKHILITRERELKNKLAVITVAMSTELKNYFEEELGVEKVLLLKPKQSPSTDDFLKAIEEVDAKHVLILPNNKNFFLSAEQAEKLEKKSKVSIVYTKSVQQGISAATYRNPKGDRSDIEKKMKKAMSAVTNSAISRASKNTKTDNVDIKKNDYLCIVNNKIIASYANKIDAINHLFKKIIDKKTKFVNVIIGQGINGNDKMSIKDYVDKHAKHVDLVFIEGNQPVYNLLIGTQ